MRDPILDDLNDAQREAVTFGTGPLMVLAGAGSGKTRVITRRIARLLRDGERAHAILALTFTNKAAGEMARRVQELGGERVMVATFHSACARFLRQDAELLGYPRDFSIYDTQDRDAVLKLLMNEHGLDGSGIKPAQLGRRLSQLKNLCTSKADLVFGYGAVDKLLQRLWDPYHAALQRLGALDFDDLLGRFRDLLLEHPDARERYQQRFRWLLVDEFQDTNRVQYELLRLLVGAEQNLCVVGDPDQSIYRFRGAEIRNILDFQRDFPGTTVVRLEDNYRSTRTILRAAEGVIENNHERKRSVCAPTTTRATRSSCSRPPRPPRRRARSPGARVRCSRRAWHRTRSRSSTAATSSAAASRRRSATSSSPTPSWAACRSSNARR
jgi:DNA helicase-2/ATP-dependent DNA helicase PcrA